MKTKCSTCNTTYNTDTVAECPKCFYNKRFPELNFKKTKKKRTYKKRI